MTRPLKVLVSAFGVPGHLCPALALAARLRDRGHDVWLESLNRWRDVAERQGLHFIQAPEYVALPRPAPGMPARPTLADRVGTLVPIMREVRPDVVVNDFF